MHEHLGYYLYMYYLEGGCDWKAVFVNLCINLIRGGEKIYKTLLAKLLVCSRFTFSSVGSLEYQFHSARVGVVSNYLHQS